MCLHSKGIIQAGFTYVHLLIALDRMKFQQENPLRFGWSNLEFWHVLFWNVLDPLPHRNPKRQWKIHHYFDDFPIAKFDQGLNHH